MLFKVQVIHEQVTKYTNMGEMSFYMQMKGINYWAEDNLSEPLIFQVQSKWS
jgi:hypothetical protein